MVKREETSNLGLPGDNFENVEKYRQALEEFSAPDEKTVKRPPLGFSKCPNRDIDEYFAFAARIGKPCFKWETIRAAFLWKLNQTICDMRAFELENTSEGSAKSVDEKEVCAQHEFIMLKASQFEGTPFTFQRLCELLTTPARHYKRLDKFLRALEKNINVVTTVTENGERVTGVDDFPDEDDDRIRGIEQTFFIKENGSPLLNKTDDPTLDDVRPMNLSAVVRENSDPKATVIQKPEESMEVDGVLENCTENEAKEVSASNEILQDKETTSVAAEMPGDSASRMDEAGRPDYDGPCNVECDGPPSEGFVEKMEE